MSQADKYVKIVEWSEEDNCFVGSCPGLFYGGCHGDDQREVFAELCQMRWLLRLRCICGWLPEESSGFQI